MEIQQLRHMQSAARHSSYARAAAECFTSRQNVAHSVKALESELGIELFERKGNSVVLTPAGKIVARRVDGIISAVDSLRVLFVEAEDQDSTISLAISNNLFAGIPFRVDEFFRRHVSQLRFLEMGCEDCYRAVLSAKADAAIISCMDRRFTSCSSYEVMESPSYIITDQNSPLAAKEQVSVSDLKDQRLMLMSEPTFQYEPLFAQLDLLGYDRNDVNVIASTGSMVHMVRRSGGGTCGIVSAKFADNPPEGTAVVPISDPQLKWHFYILYRLSAESSSMVMKLAEDVRIIFESDTLEGASMM